VLSLPPSPSIVTPLHFQPFVASSPRLVTSASLRTTGFFFILFRPSRSSIILCLSMVVNFVLYTSCSCSFSSFFTFQYLCLCLWVYWMFKCKYSSVGNFLHLKVVFLLWPGNPTYSWPSWFSFILILKLEMAI
jgi:hypothetical protein